MINCIGRMVMSDRKEPVVQKVAPDAVKIAIAPVPAAPVAQSGDADLEKKGRIAKFNDDQQKKNMQEGKKALEDEQETAFALATAMVKGSSAVGQNVAGFAHRYINEKIGGVKLSAPPNTSNPIVQAAKCQQQAADVAATVVDRGADSHVAAVKQGKGVRRVLEQEEGQDMKKMLGNKGPS